MPIIGSLRLELDEAYSAEQIRQGAWKIDGGDNGRATDNGGSGESSSQEFSFNTTINSLRSNSNLSNKIYNKAMNKTSELSDQAISSSIVSESNVATGPIINNNSMISNVRSEIVLGQLPTIVDQQSGTLLNAIVDENNTQNAFGRNDNLTIRKLPRII
jgi:hypothetical protein